jgi:hypothetical protein
VGLERGPLSLVSTIEELLERKSSGSGLENREYGLEIRHADYVALTSQASVGPSVGIARSRSQATEFSLVFFSFSVFILYYIDSYPVLDYCIQKRKLKLTLSFCISRACMYTEQSL